MSKIDFFVVVVEKKLLKTDKRNDSKEVRRTFRRKHYKHFQKKKKEDIWQFKTHKNGESISENKILKHENRLLLHPALSMQLMTD